VKLFYTDQFELPLPAGHFFPMAKYRLLRERVAAWEPRVELHIPEPATDQQLLLAHTADYVRRATHGELTVDEVRRIGFPWSPQMIERSRRSAGATIAAARSALDEGVAANLAGGTHHASASAGQGYCVFNDVAVAARVLQAEGAIERAIVIDCDAHQGNGTALIMADDPSVFTFSIHSAGSFPKLKATSDLDIPLPDGTGDEAYLAALGAGLQQALSGFQADFALYIAGADPYAGDRLGRLKLSKAGLAARDRLVLGFCCQRRLPVAIVMGGGYARDVADLVDIHAQTIEIAVGRRPAK
jgi:acetoin utilization deacetylase AcuC-like enzyme